MNTSIRQFINEAPNLPMKEIQRRSQSSIITPDDTSFSDLDAIPGIDLFLAGGISGCWNWQKPMAALISHFLERATPTTWLIDNPPFVIASPRREAGLAMDGNGAVAQIEWEHKALASSYTKSYYFTRDTVQPIVLLELGKHLANPINMFIAIENGYQRKTDVLVQSDLAIRHANVLPSHGLMLYDGAPVQYYLTTTGATAVIRFNEGQPQQEQDIYSKLAPFAKMVTAHLLRQRGLGHTLDTLNAE